MTKEELRAEVLKNQQALAKLITEELDVAFERIAEYIAARTQQIVLPRSEDDPDECDEPTIVKRGGDA